MSLFTRTAADVDALEAAVNALDDSTQPIQVRKQSLTSTQQSLSTIQPTVHKFVTKADIGEKDPNKRLYGAAMVTKIRNLDQKLVALSAHLASAAETIDTAYAEFQRAEETEREKRRAAEEEQRRLEQKREAEEELARKEEEARLEVERLEKEAALKRQKEAEELARNQREAEEKKRVEEEAAATVNKEVEEAALAAKLEEERKAAQIVKEAAEAADREKAKAAAITVTVKTTRGKNLSLSAVPPDCTVSQFKKLVEDQHAIPSASQRLIFHGRLLSDVRSIDSYRVVDGSAIHLVENSRASAASNASALASTPKPIVPPGTVCHLGNGKEQFDSISQNCASHRLVVVDWSASWCGPCRMIAPVFERLATRFSDVTFVKVDTEASAANSQLASEKGISAYPTFHFYIAGRLVHNFSGANASGIEAGINKCRPMVTTAPAASPSASRTSAGPSASGALTRRVLGALTTLKNNCAQQEFVVAVRTLLTFVRNVVDNPGQEKYRKVRTANNTFQTRLASRIGGMDCMRAFGFEQTSENGSAFLVLSPEAAANPELSTIKVQLEQAVAAAQPSQGQQSAAPPGMRSEGQPAMNSTSPPPVGGFPPGMGGDIENEAYRSVMMEMMTYPGFAEVATELASDPSAVETLMQVQRAVESGDPTAFQQLQSNPNLARLQTALASNPAFVTTMMRRMADGGLPAMPGMPGAPSPNRNGPGTNAGTFGVQDQNAAAPGTTNTNPAPSYPGAPTTAEEEERLLQEAIRLSMGENKSPQNQTEQGNDENSPDEEG